MIEAWHDFFLMVGGGAAALAGLVFVAMSENVKMIVRDPTHKHRAVGTLAGFTSVFVICGLALMGTQNMVAVAVEWVAVSIVAGCIYFYGFFAAKAEDGSRATLSFTRVVVGGSLYGLQAIGSVFYIFSGAQWGLYLAGAALVISLAYMITGAWLLIVGVHQ